jgi:capsid portal protein
MTKIDSFSFGVDNSPVFVEKINRSHPFVSWGLNNAMPEELYVAVDYSPIHSSAIRTKVDNAVGRGFIKDYKINKKETLNDVAKQIFFEYVVTGNLFLELTWRMDRREGIDSIHIIPAKYMRAKAPENAELYSDKWLYCRDWYNYRKAGLVEFVEFDPQNFTDRQILHIRNYTPGMEFYGSPSYLAAFTDVRLSRAISEYNLNSILNGAQPSLWVNFPQEPDSQNDMEDVLRRLEARYSGPTNAGRVIVSYGSEGVKPDITTISPTLQGGMFAEIFALVRENILAGHQIPDPSICGLPSGASGFSSQADQLRTAQELFMKTTIQPLQEFMLKELNPIIKLMYPNEDVNLEIEQNEFLKPVQNVI